MQRVYSPPAARTMPTAVAVSGHSFHHGVENLAWMGYHIPSARSPIVELSVGPLAVVAMSLVGLAAPAIPQSTATSDGPRIAECSRGPRIEPSGDIEAMSRVDLGVFAKRSRELCDEGDGAACSNLATLHYYGIHVEQNWVLAARFYRRGCAGRQSRGCYNLAVMKYHGQGLAQDERAAASLFRGICKKGDTGACDALGQLYEFGEGVEEDAMKAATLYRKACDEGFSVGCYNLGRLYYHGRGVERSFAESARLFRKACRGGVGVACSDR